MKKLFLSLLLMGGMCMARAAAPTGPFTFSFSNNIPILDLTGDYSVTLPVEGGDLSLTFSLSNSVAGVLQGSGDFTLTQPEGQGGGSNSVRVVNVNTGSRAAGISRNGTGMNIAATRNGINNNRGKRRGQSVQTVAQRNEAIRQRNRLDDIPQYIFQFRLRGTGLFTGVEHDVNGNLTYRAQFDPTANQLVGTISGSVAMVDLRTLRIRQTLALPLASGMTGAWDLLLDLTNSGRDIGGTGSIVLSNGRTIPVLVQGRFNPNTDISQITLIPTDRTGHGTSLRLIGTGDTLTLQSISGRLFGRNFSEEAELEDTSTTPPDSGAGTGSDTGTGSGTGSGS